MSVQDPRAVSLAGRAWLIAVLGTPSEFMIAGDEPGTPLLVGMTTFRAVDGCGFPGFHDRLRDKSGRCVGLEVSPIHGNKAFEAQLVESTHVRIMDDAGTTQVLLRDPVGSLTSDGDQAFGGDVYRDGAGRWALSIPLYQLTVDDLSDILSAPVHWVGSPPSLAP